LKDRIQDALCATRAASDEGVVPGGGSALLFASKKLDKIKGENFDQDVGIKIVREACKIPTKTICKNAGFEGSIVVDKLLEAGDNKRGFDASKGEYVDMLKAGILDPTKVLTTEAMIVE
jgi:chaperonin GroEL